MSESGGWQFAVDIHPPEWRFPAGSSWLAGWIISPEIGFVTDLRAWVDNRPFLGLYGMPGSGHDESLHHRPGPPYAGFSFLIEPHRGATLLRLESRNPGGEWKEFFRTLITVATDAPLAPIPPPLSSRLANLLPELLRNYSGRSQTSWAALAEEVLAGSLAVPLNSLPNPPFHGALEEPRDTGRLRYGRLAVTGWLSHRTEKIKRLTALVDALQECTLLHGLPRADIGSVFADLPGREHSQFVGHVDLPSHQSTPVLLKIFAELENGEKHLAFAQRFNPHVIAGTETPLPPLSRFIFARALWSLCRSARTHELPIGSPGAFLTAAKAVWAAYRAEAPTTRARARVSHPVLSPEKASSSSPLRLLVVTHNLNFEGAPWFIFELSRYLSRQSGVTVRVLSPHDGPMRRVFTDAGMPLEVVDLSTALTADTAEKFDAHLRASVKIDWDQIDLVIANTMVSFWAVHLATARRIPSLLYVHESSPIRRFFEPLLKPALFESVEQAFRNATHVVFTAESSRVVFDYLDLHGNFRLLPSWVDVERIDGFAASHDKASLRRKHGLDPAATLLVNIGSLCERKGQHLFVRAARLLQTELPILYPDRKIQFVMVGARPGVYLDSLQQEVALHKLDNVVFIPESGEIHDFYRLADIFVCTSFEESFPRVILESAAYRLPIVSTNVNGIAEMLGADDAWLLPPGDSYQLAGAVKLALAAHFGGDTRRAESARANIAGRFHEDRSLPLHLALIRPAVRS